MLELVVVLDLPVVAEPVELVELVAIRLLLPTIPILPLRESSVWLAEAVEAKAA